MRYHLALVLASILAACAPPAKQTPTVTPASRSFLTSVEMARLPPGSTLLEAVEQLRSEFLTLGRSRGYNDSRQQLMVVMDGVLLGTIAVLQGIRTDGVAQLQYLKASEAWLRFGTRVAGPVLLVTMRADPRAP